MGPFETIELNAPGGVPDSASATPTGSGATRRTRRPPRCGRGAVAQDGGRLGRTPSRSRCAEKSLCVTGDWGSRAHNAHRNPSRSMVSARSSGKKMLVTVAASGIGLATAEMFARDGASVASISSPMIRAAGRGPRLAGAGSP